MDKNTVLYVIAALLVGFIGGFLLANSMNRSEMNTLRTQSAAPAPPSSNNSPGDSGQNGPSLSNEEIRAKIEQADKNPTNFDYQKNLGTALYKYAAMKQLPELLPDTIRILERADSINNKDADVLSALGNAHFDLGFQKKDPAEFEKARTIYARSLALKPGDLDVQTDEAITWYVQPGPDYAKAAAGLEKVVSADPKHSRAMVFLAQAYIKLGRKPDAQKLVDKIKAIDPTDDSIAELNKQLAEGK